METKTKVKATQAQAKPLHISGAEAVVRCLLAEGADLIYGYPGGAIMPIYDELYKFQDQLHHVLTRHEQGATHAAQGFARTSGKHGQITLNKGEWNAAFLDELFQFPNALVHDDLVDALAYIDQLAKVAYAYEYEEDDFEILDPVAGY